MNPKNKALICVILAGVLWGTSGLFVHYLAPYGLTSLQMACIRGTVAAVCMSAYVALTHRPLLHITRRQLLLAACSGACTFLSAASYYAAIQASSVSTAVILMYTSPIYVMILSVLFLGEKLTPRKLLSVGMMLAGCALVSGIVGGMKFSVLGIFLGLFSGVAYSGYNLVTKIQMRNGCSPITASMYSFIFMSLFSLLFSQPAGILEVAAAAPVSIPLMLACGVCTFVLPYFLYTTSLQTLPAGTASALGIVEPLAATVFSILFLKERLTIFSACGMVIIALAVYLLSSHDE